MAEIRVLENPARPMQRLGYLKHLLRRVTVTSTSSLNNLGHNLVDAVTRKIKVPLNQDRANYIKQRLYDRTYKTLKDQADTWLKNGLEGEPPTVSMELQDLYLTDPALPSQTGKLVKNDWRKYPPLGVNLGLIRAGTYSANTRALSLLHFTVEAELMAFLEYQPEANPLWLSKAQSLLLLYSLLENDGEAIGPLWAQLHQDDTQSFSDRDAGNLLADIYLSIVTRHRKRLLSADDRERLEIIEKSAESIARWRDASYSGGGAREEASRPRVEPYVDISLLSKPDPFKYEYIFSSAGRIWAAAFGSVQTSEEVVEFLSQQFFSTAARAWEIEASTLSETEEIIRFMYRAWESIRSSGGYAPIEEVALVAGITALIDHQLIIEPAVAREALLVYQKANPYQIRFTVNRMGVLAHTRFLEEPAAVPS